MPFLSFSFHFLSFPSLPDEHLFKRKGLRKVSGDGKPQKAGRRAQGDKGYCFLTNATVTGPFLVLPGGRPSGGGLPAGPGRHRAPRGGCLVPVLPVPCVRVPARCQGGGTLCSLSSPRCGKLSGGQHRAGAPWGGQGGTAAPCPPWQGTGGSAVPWVPRQGRQTSRGGCGAR